ncbi:MAG: hypothetical protein OXG53_08995 [Chloroflexi bacterium]|nr:hypothetical protein [Chloroflexota bacterium]
MPQIEVMLEVPLKIAAGLASGQLERVGGVVVDAASKQVVAWLREGGQMANNPDLAGGLLKTVLDLSAGGLASNAIGLLDTAVTARSHFLIMQQLQGLSNLVGFAAGIGVLNLGATIISTAVMLKRLGDLEKAIEGLYELVTKEFSQDRRVKLASAIQTAKNAMTFEDNDPRTFQANLAINSLYAARQHIWLEMDNMKGSAGTAENNKLMQDNLLQAMQLDELRSRCLLELNLQSNALEYLTESLGTYRESTRHLIHRHLGEHRAVYFHKSVAESDLMRYFAIEHWLRSEGDRLLEIVLANRHDFWNRDIASESTVAAADKDRRRRRRKRNKASSDDQPHIEALTMSELLIENYQRFEGLHAEIQAIERLRISHSDWENQQNVALAKAEISLDDHNDYVLLVDEDWLADQSDSTAA